MSGSNFVDYIKIFCRSGNGGAGSAHFRREKLIPKADPMAATEAGADILFCGATTRCGHCFTLNTSDIFLRVTVSQGGEQQSTGADGKDVIIEVPLGTVAKIAERRRNHFRNNRKWRGKNPCKRRQRRTG